MKIKRENLDYVRQALYEGIRGREVAREKLGTPEADRVCREVDDKIIKVYHNLIKRITRELQKDKGQSDILTLGFMGYLVLIVVVVLCIF